MKAPPEATELECIADRDRAATLLHPTRLRVLEEMRSPASATEVAGRLDMPRQRVNYHVRALEKNGLVKRAGKRRKRNMVEQRYVATARRYVIAPEVLGSAALSPKAIEDRFSAGYRLALGTQLASELGRAMREAEEQEKRLSTLSVSSRLRFEDPEQRAAFARALEEAVVDVVARFASPDVAADGTEGGGRPYRLMVGCWPIPPEEPKT